MQKQTVNRKNFFVFNLFLSFTIMLLGLLACENKKPIKVGFSGCLTGKLSDLGISGRNGALIAVEEINASGGIKGRSIELIVKDDKHDAQTAIRADQELIDEGVAAIIGHMTSAMSIAALPLINKNKIVMISPTTSTNKLTGIDDYFFRMLMPNRRQTDKFARYAFHKMGIKTLTFLYDLSNKTYTEGWYRNFKSEFEKMGGKIIQAISFTSGQNVDYLGITQSAIKTDPDAMLFVSGAIDTAMICQQLKKMAYNRPIFAAGWSRTDELIKHGGSAVEGISFFTYFDKRSKNKRYIEFRSKFKERFGKDPDLAAVHSFEAIQLLINALRSAESFVYLKRHIQKQKTFKGLQGIIEMDRYGDAIRKIFLVRVENGKFVTIGD
ncbi:ABC transporter substrate-binding protein [Desulfococcaceae bacterium HSG9]|nr:ABC transporter substrate-binding protein [Desulfococcaceae bacterium HSG9]